MEQDKALVGNIRLLPISSGGIELYNCGFQARNPNHAFGPLSRDEYILQYVLAGKGNLYAHNKTYTVQTGDLFLLERNTLLHYASNPADPYTYYWVGFGGSAAAELLALIGFSSDCPVHNCSDPQVEVCMRSIYECGNRTDKKALMLAFSEFYRMFSLLLPSATGVSTVAVTTINRAIAILHERYCEELHIGQLCCELGIDRTYFSVLFRRATGMSPGEYLIKVRLSQACKLLKTDMAITEIAMACGFPDASNFSVRFKKMIGKTPRQYRRDLTEH